MDNPPPLPTFLRPMLAHPGRPFDSDQHLFEIKWDGIRALAEALVEQRTCREFDLARYQDEYAGKLQQLIEAKVNGQSVPAAKEHEPGQALSLMEALRKSVAPNGRAAAGRKRAGHLPKKGATARNAKSRRRPRQKSA